MEKSPFFEIIYNVAMDVKFINLKGKWRFTSKSQYFTSGTLTWIFLFRVQVVIKWKGLCIIKKGKADQKKFITVMKT